MSLVDRHSYEKVKILKYLGSLLTSQNSIPEEIIYILKEEKSCSYSVHTLLTSRFFSENLKIKIHNTITIPVTLYDCEKLYFILRQKRR